MEENRNEEKKNDNELTFFQFLVKCWIFPMTLGLVPMLVGFVKQRAFEWDTFVVSVFAVFAFGFCIFRVRKIKW